MFDVPSLVCNGDANSCELLYAQIKHYYYDEFNINVDDEDNAPSVDDIKCLNIYESSITKEKGQYYLKLPFKNDDVKLPNNKTQAESRLLQQRKMMKKDFALKEFYVETFQKLIATNKVEAVNVENEQKSNRIFYIPHFVTRQAKKRLVYDGFAQFQNVSLNSVLYKGCDNLQRLCDVILRFRRFKIAFSCDIKDMFLQCGIVERDRDSLRVLWFNNNDIDNDIVEYKFKRLPYCLNCSMSMADYCLRKTVNDNVVRISAIEAVKSSVYVDDGLISCKDVAEGRKCANEIIALLQSGGFDLRKFVSENNEIIADIDADRLLNCNTPKDVSNDQLHECKVLSVQWNHRERTLSPKVNLNIKSETKRDLWVTIAQIFDPIGIFALYLLPGRKLL